MAANEGDAIAIASGAYFAKRKPVVLMQNSGLTNAVSPLTSLNYIFDLPILGFVSLRGEPGLKDEPQHELMGQITEDMLTLMRVEWEYLSDNIDNARQQIERAEAHMSQGKTFFLSQNSKKYLPAYRPLRQKSAAISAIRSRQYSPGWKHSQSLTTQKTAKPPDCHNRQNRAGTVRDRRRAE
ncbi:hypothetical protein CHS0354_006902 [Potamilus streckersoni]|uniref:Phosphonopyruvate decarboxylase n=1 Tax=Potamilus streckersoni TaxID=2493646 RepID=A0AAE0TEP0_9BIVA|nr:hypothetical protein CHS0354_006902 [Potamilus streckersoni]